MSSFRFGFSEILRGKVWNLMENVPGFFFQKIIFSTPTTPHPPYLFDFFFWNSPYKRKSCKIFKTSLIWRNHLGFILDTRLFYIYNNPFYPFSQQLSTPLNEMFCCLEKFSLWITVHFPGIYWKQYGISKGGQENDTFIKMDY